MQIIDKVFVVTGGGNGIGREVVLGLVARGAKVAALDLREDSLEETARLARAEDRLTLHSVDVSDKDAVTRAFAEVISAHGQVDGLLNVAGIIQRFVPIVELELSEIEKVVAVNFWGVVHTTKAALPHLVTRPEACLINVSSMGGLTPVPGQGAYCASKAAVNLLTEGLWAELRSTNVAVTLVVPGAIGTDISVNSGVATAAEAARQKQGSKLEVTSAQDAAAQLIDAIEKGPYRITIGKDAALVDRLSRLSPRRATEMIAKRMEGLLST